MEGQYSESHSQPNPIGDKIRLRKTRTPHLTLAGDPQVQDAGAQAVPQAGVWGRPPPVLHVICLRVVLPSCGSSVLRAEATSTPMGFKTCFSEPLIEWHVLRHSRSPRPCQEELCGAPWTRQWEGGCYTVRCAGPSGGRTSVIARSCARSQLLDQKRLHSLAAKLRKLGLAYPVAGD